MPEKGSNNPENLERILPRTETVEAVKSLIDRLSIYGRTVYSEVTAVQFKMPNGNNLLIRVPTPEGETQYGYEVEAEERIFLPDGEVDVSWVIRDKKMKKFVSIIKADEVLVQPAKQGLMWFENDYSDINEKEAQNVFNLLQSIDPNWAIDYDSE